MVILTSQVKTPGSSNGRTADSESANWGSNPYPGTLKTGSKPDHFLSIIMPSEIIKIKRQYATQLSYFQSQIPLGKDSPQVSISTIQHFHALLDELQQKTGEDFSKYRVPESEIWNPGESYMTNGLRDRLGSLIGYLTASDVEKEKEAGSKEIFSVISHIKKNLRKLFRQKPTSEKEVQEKIEDLFIGAELDYQREKVHIPYSSKTYIPDFTFNDISCAVEAKYCNNERREKELIDEINADIKAYRTRYDNLVFVVYDCGFIRDTDIFIGDIVGDGVLVEVIKH